MEIGKYGNREIWKNGNMEIWKYENMEIWKKIHIWRKMKCYAMPNDWDFRCEGKRGLEQQEK